MPKNCTDCLNWAPDAPDLDYCELSETPAVRTWTSSVLQPLLIGGQYEAIDCSNCPGFLDADCLLSPIDE